MKSQAPHPAMVFFALIVVQVLFGLNYVISKVIVNVFPPLVWATLRAFIATCILLGVAFLLRRPHPKDGWKFFGPLILYSALGTIINQSSFLVGLHYTTPTNAAVLNTLIPVFTVLVVTIRGQERASLKKMFGFLCSLVGVLILRKVEEFRLSDSTLFGDFLMIVNCLSYALFLSFAKKFIETHDRLWTTAYMFLYATVGIGLLGHAEWVGFTPPVMTSVLWVSATFAIVGGTLLTYFLNNWSLAHANPSQVALLIYIQPVIAAVFAFFWLGTPITLRTVLSSLVIFVGLIFALDINLEKLRGRQT